MLRKLLVTTAMLCTLAAHAASVDINKASAADLDGIKGIGPSTSTRIQAERKKGEFKDWADLMSRVKGIGEPRAAKLSAQGLTVGGAAFKAGTGAEKPAQDKAMFKAVRPAAAKVANHDTQ